MVPLSIELFALTSLKFKLKYKIEVAIKNVVKTVQVPLLVWTFPLIHKISWDTP